MRKSLCWMLGIMTVVMTARSAPAANRYWDTSTSTNFQPGDGIWDTNAANATWNVNGTG